MESEKKESKYAKKLIARRRFGGPEHRSLGNCEKGQEKFLPLPRPFHFDYFPNRAERNEYLMQKQALNTLLPFEKPEFIAKFRSNHASR